MQRRRQLLSDSTMTKLFLALAMAFAVATGGPIVTVPTEPAIAGCGGNC
jgi:hypothetical protein